MSVVPLCSCVALQNFKAAYHFLHFSLLTSFGIEPLEHEKKKPNLYKLDNSLCPSQNLQDIIQVHDAIKKEVQTKGHPFH